MTTMLMEVVTVLHTPEVTLNPAHSAEQRALEDCPPAQEVRTHIGVSGSVARSQAQKLGMQVHYSQLVEHLVWPSLASQSVNRWEILYRLPRFPVARW